MKMRLLLRLAALTLSTSISAQMFRGNAAHSGVYPLASPADEGRTLIGVQWRVATGGDVVSSPTVAGETVYVGSGDGRLYAVDLRSGSKKWTYDAGSPIHSSPAAGDGRVFFAARSGALVALDAATGVQRWRVPTGADKPLPWGHESGDYYTSSPVLAGGMVIFAAGDGDVYALNPADGTPRWRASIGERLRASPVVSGEQVIVGSIEGRVHALALRDGARQWTFETTGVTLKSGDFGYDRRTIQSSPAVMDGVVYVGARDGTVYAVGAADGKERWRYSHGMSWIIASPAVLDGVVYAASSDAAFVQALSAKDGKELWRTPTDQSPVWSSPAVAGGVVYAGDFGGRLRALDRESGRALWSFRSGGQILGSPSVAGDLVVFGSGDGSVYALRVGKDNLVRRAVFGKSDAQPPLDKFLQDRGYGPLDAAELKPYLDARVNDKRPSVIVLLQGDPPAEALPSLRRYLDAGGKLVLTGPTPGLWPPDPAIGRRTLKSLDFEAPLRLFGVDHARTLFDPRGARATAAGERWGLVGNWRTAWSIGPETVSEVLAIDEWGLAAAWIKSYGGDKGTGLVRVPDHDPQLVYLAAEYRPR